jgi:hypothetical protein
VCAFCSFESLEAARPCVCGCASGACASPDHQWGGARVPAPESCMGQRTGMHPDTGFCDPPVAWHIICSCDPWEGHPLLQHGCASASGLQGRRVATPRPARGLTSGVSRGASRRGVHRPAQACTVRMAGLGQLSPGVAEVRDSHSSNALSHAWKAHTHSTHLSSTTPTSHITSQDKTHQNVLICHWQTASALLLFAVCSSVAHSRPRHSTSAPCSAHIAVQRHADEQRAGASGPTWVRGAATQPRPVCPQFPGVADCHLTLAFSLLPACSRAGTPHRMRRPPRSSA